jgi:hypothetical protein
MKLNQVLTTIAAAAVASFSAFTAQAGYVRLYSSVPDLTASPALNGFCSDCNGFGFRVYDQVSFSQLVAVHDISFDVETDFGDAPGPNQFAGLLNVSIFDDDAGQPGDLLLNDTVVPGNGPGGYSYVDLSDNVSIVTVSGLDTQFFGGDYWVSFSGASNPSNLGVTVFDGGPGAALFQQPDGSYIDLGLSTGLQVNGAYVVPEPATWTLMLLGVAAVGAGLRMARRRKAVTAV